MSTTARQTDPFYPIHPGEIVKDEIEYRGVTQRDLATKMGVSHTQLNEILNGKRPVNTGVALLFEAALGLEPLALVNMQTRFDMQTARRDSTLAKRLDTIRRACASVALA